MAPFQRRRCLGERADFGLLSRARRTHTQSGRRRESCGGGLQGGLPPAIFSEVRHDFMMMIPVNEPFPARRGRGLIHRSPASPSATPRSLERRDPALPRSTSRRTRRCRAPGRPWLSPSRRPRGHDCSECGQRQHSEKSPIERRGEHGIAQEGWMGDVREGRQAHLALPGERRPESEPIRPGVSCWALASESALLRNRPCRLHPGGVCQVGDRGPFGE